MNIAPEHLAAIQSYGYSRAEAEFLYLVATHSGYFTQRQFLRFARIEKGGAASRFTQRVLQLRHGRLSQYGYHTFIYNLYSRLIYGPIDKDNLRNRRRLSNDLIRTRLLILDFVLGHLDQQYLETEADKVAYFHGKQHVPLPVLPSRIYTGIKFHSTTRRYFVDRFPIFVLRDSSSLSVPPVPTFIYCDLPDPGLLRYISHLRTYEGFLHRLPAFNFIYAAPNQAKFKRAANFFSRLFGNGDDPDTRRLVRYFEIRQLWENHETNSLTRADRQLLREGDQRFHAQGFQAAYRYWTTANLSETALRDLLRGASSEQSRQFSTYILPEPYTIFERFSKDHLSEDPGTIFRNRSSKVGSSLRSPTVQGNSLESQ
jgi:hypothetical protein